MGLVADFERNLPMILGAILIFIGILTFFAILGINFNPKIRHHIDKIVTIEGYRRDD